MQAYEARWLPAILFLCALLAANGCATTQGTAPQGRVTRIEVPFFPQEDFQCGPAALATVLNYWYGKAGTAKGLTPEEIVAEIYSPSARGVLGIDLEFYAQKQGFQTEQVAGTVDVLKNSIDKGIPPIVLVDYGFLAYQRNHFMVVRGYTDSALLVNSGRRQSEHIANGELLKVWKKTGYWMLLVKP